MLDKNGRITISSELLEKAGNVKKGEKVKIFFERDKKRLDINPTYILGDVYFIAAHKMDEKGRIYIPASIRETFSNSTYLPAEKNGEIYILIIEHEKKSE